MRIPSQAIVMTGLLWVQCVAGAAPSQPNQPPRPPTSADPHADLRPGSRGLAAVQTPAGYGSRRHSRHDGGDVDHVAVGAGRGPDRAAGGAARRSSFRARSDAYEKLQQLGPSVLPIVTRHRDDADPEVRQRIESLIGAYQWMRNGGVVTSLSKDTIAPTLGIRVGDVVLRVNDIDIVDQNIPTETMEYQRTFYLWRQGQIVTVNVPPGRVGIWTDDWDIDKGGADQAAGLAALANGRYDQAYELLQRTVSRG